MPMQRDHYPAGIYRLFNRLNGKSYVGSSIDLLVRKATHFRQLRTGNSHSRKLQNAFNRYGEESFCFEVLEECAKEILQEREQYWMHLLNAVEHGYNSSYDVRVPTRGIIHPPEVREHMRAAQKNRTRSAEERRISGATISDYNKSLRGVPKTAEHRQRISEALRGRTLGPEHIAKLQGRRPSEKSITALISYAQSDMGRERTGARLRGKTGADHNRSRPVSQLTLDGTVIATFPGASEASRSIGIGRTAIKNCVNGYSKSAGGYVWKHA